MFDNILLQCIHVTFNSKKITDCCALRMINFLFLVFGIDVDVLSVEQDPGHLEVTVGHGLVQGRHSVRVRDVHIHRRM